MIEALKIEFLGMLVFSEKTFGVLHANNFVPRTGGPPLTASSQKCVQRPRHLSIFDLTPKKEKATQNVYGKIFSAIERFKWLR